MIDIVDAGKLFVALSGKEPVETVVGDAQLIEGDYSKFFPAGQPPDWKGLSESPDFVPIIQALGREFIALVQLAQNKAELQEMRAIVASLG